MTSPNSYYLMVTFWGERFREYFYSLCLSSLLSPNNLPALRGVPGCKFIICTSKDDWTELQGRPLFEQMREYMEPVFIDIGYPGDGDQPILHMSKGHRFAARRAIADRVWAGFVAPDLLVSDGMVPFVLDRASNGKKAVLAPALRYAMEPVMAALGQRELLRPDQPLRVEPRLLGKLAYESLHSEIRRYEFDAPYFGDYPIWSYWHVPGRNGIVLHTVSWALLLGNFADIRHYTDSDLHHNTIDADYVYRNFYRKSFEKDIYLSSDSDELLFMGLTPESELTYLPFQERPINRTDGGEDDRLYNIHRFLYSPAVDKFRRWAYKVPIQIHGDELTPASIETAKKSASKIERAINMGVIGQTFQRLYSKEFSRGRIDPNRYPNSPIKVFFAIFRLVIRDLIWIISQEAPSRILRAAFGWWIGPALGRLERRQLLRILRLVPRRYLRPVLKRVHSFQARKNSEDDSRYAEGRASH